MTARNDDIPAIKKLAADWRSGWLKGDADALLALWSDKPVLMPHGHPPILSKHTIRSMYQALFKQVVIKSKGVLKEVKASGDWGYFWSTYELTATPKAGGKPIRSKGKSLFIVKRQRGRWKIARLIDNSDQPE